MSDWLKQNVLPHLVGYKRIPRTQIAKEIKEFIGNDPKPEFWAYYADYDWVVFCQLFGRMVDLPDNFPKLCMDIKQLAMSKGSPKLPKQDKHLQHHALFDAVHDRKIYQFLTGESEANDNTNVIN